jgi:type I restriction enzyme, R subunit
MSNFDFLAAQFPTIHRAAARAESYVRGDARTACFHARRALELIIFWLYDNDNRFFYPYENHLNALLHGDSFRQYVPPDITDKAHLIRRTGNSAVHDSRPIAQNSALTILQELFQITYWLARTYGPPAARADLPDRFVLDKVPPSAASLKKQSLAALKQQAARLAEQDEALRQRQAENEALKAELAAVRTQFEQQRLQNERVPDRHDYTPNEAQTRELIIDLLLHEAGWTLPQPPPTGINAGGVSVEYRVTGMPNRRGWGRVDYILWGDDGLPLALIEAKRTSRDPRDGKRQAKLYADCLEQAFGRRPFIFYTNGYQTHLWDDQRYSPRLVEGFYTKDDLERHIQRRQTAHNLDDVATTKTIVDRYYQEEAIRHLTAQLSNGRRKGLLAMATGTGKTRTAIAIVDLLMRANWVKRVLFLADRTALVNQAIKAFKKHLPQANPVNLLEDKEARESRIVVSTHHTVLNQIDQIDDESGQRLFSVGHFDLIIIDEAHRSVYHKFGAIFAYFDSLLLGLTATPKDEVDRNTYQLFDLEPGVPTYAYDLDRAVADGHLVPPNPLSVPTQFTREGIKYDDLTDEEKARWDLLEWHEDGHIPDEVSTADLNKWLFNESTVDEVLKNLMQHGLKVAGGDRLGKTIIFAKNQAHARYIVERFDHHYPQYAGEFTAVITSSVSYAQSLIDDFSEVNKPPHIAVSVDMLDTGIDIPELVNLVFFKLVRSKTKFFQMIGRGTRLCPDLFGPGQHKSHFNIFDHCQNFEFFNQHPQGISSRPPVPLSRRIFSQRLALLAELEPLAARQPDGAAAALSQSVKDHLQRQVAGMNVNNFIVRPKREYVEKFAQRAAWDRLTPLDRADLDAHVAGLPSAAAEEVEGAKRFDNLLLQLQLAWLSQAPVWETLKNRVMDIAQKLETQRTIPRIEAQIGLIFDLQREEFWQTMDLATLEEIRRSLRDLVELIPRQQVKPLYTQFSDTLAQVKEVTPAWGSEGVDRARYRKKIEQFIRDNGDMVAIYKIRHAMPLNQEDIAALEAFFYEADIVGGREAFAAAYGQADNLALFIRRLVGLDRRAAKEKFSRYLDDKIFTADQITFVTYLIDQLTQTGVVEVGELYERPFTDLHEAGLDGIFADETADNLLALIDEVNRV